jgi:hypothetical protein
MHLWLGQDDCHARIHRVLLHPEPERPGVAAHVDPFESKGLKPRYQGCAFQAMGHLDSRVETKAPFKLWVIWVQLDPPSPHHGPGPDPLLLLRQHQGLLVRCVERCKLKLKAKFETGEIKV